MSSQYIHQLENWPRFGWDYQKIGDPLANVSKKQGMLLGAMETLGFEPKQETFLNALFQDVRQSSEIEGETLDAQQVRSSIARRLGLEHAGLPLPDRQVEGIVDMTLDATQNYEEPLTEERLFNWHAALFPTGRSGMHPITVAAWRTDESGPMQVVSGPIGKERVHYEAPSAMRIPEEIRRFIDWFEGEPLNPVLKAAVAHLWFETIHPFDDGNGRIGRAVMDLALARSDKTSRRYYSMSAQINRQRDEYYDILEASQRGTLDATPWILWFLNCLEKAIANADAVVDTARKKLSVKQLGWYAELNPRQNKVLNLLIDGFNGKLTSSKWAKIAKCSQDTAHRDIVDLMARGILKKDSGGGRSTSYSLTPLDQLPAS